MHSMLKALAFLHMLSVLTLWSAACTFAQAPDESIKLAIFPTPQHVTAGVGAFAVNKKVAILFDPGDRDRPGLHAQAAVLADGIELLTGCQAELLPHTESDRDHAILLRLVEGDPTGSQPGIEALHGYSLRVETGGIVLQAASPEGIALGIASLFQLLQPTATGFLVPRCLVDDAPALAYRSIMIDVARTPHSIAVLEDVVRLAHLYKLRYLHLHLTDDQHFTFPFAGITDQLENNFHYSRDELRGLVKYAAARGITIIPEIDLPGHSSRLRESGYLPEATSDRDVANETNFPRIARLLDEVMAVFSTSPYLHIGGDESGAGETLLPFLGRVQQHVRQRGKHLIVWEGFHGAPVNLLPPTGADRVIVAAWESSYNAPWDLLQAGYTLINASWKPLYVVGGDSAVHPGSTGGRKWTPEEMAGWTPAAFWHWEPGRPVFEDAGPNDPNRNDQVWNAAWIDRETQILGAQVSVWEQQESSVIRDLRMRLPVFAERVWSTQESTPAEVLAAAQAADAKVFGIVQPVGVQTAPHSSPIHALFESPPAGGVRLFNRTQLGGQIRYRVAGFQGDLNWLAWKTPEDPMREGMPYQRPLDGQGGYALRAQLMRGDGRPVPGQTWARIQQWPDRVSVIDYEIGARTPKTFPDFGTFTEAQVLARYRLPMLRGPIGHTRVRGQRFRASLQAPDSGEYTISMKTQSGRARLWLDLDHDGLFSSKEELVTETPNTEELQSTPVRLHAEQVYALRVDHISGLPRPVVLVYLEGPGIEGRKEISSYLVPLDSI